jgi:esterase/lipase superfamily enzyme
VFVHGFNVKFDAALQRGAQLVRNLNFDGPLFVFSWPSQGDWKRYGTDRVAAGNASDALVAFLTEVAAATGTANIHVIAHSMGNRVLLPALVKVAANPVSPLRGRLGEVILAAPAVPERDFATWVDGAIRDGSPRFTLYASAVDKAMLAGYVVEWGTVLAGHATSGEPLLHGKVESIDISEAGTSGLFDLNHDVFASNPVMSEDMRQLLQTGQRPPSKRIDALVERKGKQSGVVYWH